MTDEKKWPDEPFRATHTSGTPVSVEPVGDGLPPLPNLGPNYPPLHEVQADRLRALITPMDYARHGVITMTWSEVEWVYRAQYIALDICRFFDWDAVARMPRDIDIDDMMDKLHTLLTAARDRAKEERDAKWDRMRKRYPLENGNG